LHKCVRKFKSLDISYTGWALSQYIDFNKAFDSGAHEKLFYCLNQYGVRGELLLWLTH